MTCRLHGPANPTMAIYEWKVQWSENVAQSIVLDVMCDSPPDTVETIG